MKAQTDFLATVVERKRTRLAHAVANRSRDQVRAEAFERRKISVAHAFRTALGDEKAVNVIAEFKKASPSKGDLHHHRMGPAKVASAYRRGGAAAISVLTEEDYFGGSLDDLVEVRGAVNLPILRKDFIIDEYQLYESAAAGADALLLIAALLDETTLTKLRAISENELGMDALVEVHDATEMRIATAAGATLLGVNNRNLHTFEVSLDVSFKLAKIKPPDTILVSESGLSNSEQIKKLRAVGFSGFLIGESLMRSNDPEADLRNMMSEAEVSTS